MAINLSIMIGAIEGIERIEATGMTMVAVTESGGMKTINVQRSEFEPTLLVG